MAYVVQRKTGTWELREARSTSVGPRSRTLATFRTLTPEVVAHAQARSAAPPSAAEIHAAARRAGAPVARPAVDQAAADLLAHLAARHRPRPALRQLLRDALGADHPDEAAPSDAARAAAPWIAATAAERAAALRDLLLLADRIPAPRARPARRRFPHIDSRAA